MPTLTDSTSVSTTITTTITTTKSSSISQLPPLNNQKQDHQTTSSRRRSRKQSSTTALTEENLEEFNHQALQKIQLKKYVNSSSSPYYRGLTDSTLIITRERGLLSISSSIGASPTKDSNISRRSSSSNSSSVSSVFNRIQTWSSSCFRSNKNVTDSGLPNEPSSSVYNKTMEAKLVSASSTTVTTKKQSLGVQKAGSPPLPMAENKKLVMKEKSLKKSVSSSSSSVGTSITLDDNGNVVGGQPISVVVKDEKKMKKNKIKEKKYVWADRYRPKDLKHFICNRDKAENLQNLVKEGGQCSHYIFEGPAGVGKTTMVWAFLREAFGVEDLKTREEKKTFELKGEAEPSVEVLVKISSKHVEINLSQLCGYEKHVIAALTRESQSILFTKNKVRPKCDPTNCYAIIIHEADKLSRDAQLYIRWLMERNDQGCTKIFFCCTQTSKLQHIRSICTVVQLFPPSNKEIVEVLEFIAEKESIQLPSQLAERIADNSKHNLRQAIRSFEATWHFYNEFSEDQVLLTGWEEDVANIAENIIAEQSPRQLYIVRGKFQNLIDHNVSPDFIFTSLVGELKKRLSEEFHSKIDAFFLEYKMDSGVFDGEESLVILHSRYKESKGKGNIDLGKDVQHFMMIEEFTAKFMTYYKAYTKKKNLQLKEQKN